MSKYFYFFAILFTVFNIYTPEIVNGSEFSKTDEIKNFVKNELSDYKEIMFTSVPRGLVISVATDDLFSDGEAEILEDSHNFLKKIGKIINLIGKPCVIEGNALTQKEGDEISNIELSLMRADEIVEFLIKKCDISPNTLRAIGFGKMMPFDDNVSYKGHMNKRIDFVILNYEAKR